MRSRPVWFSGLRLCCLGPVVLALLAVVPDVALAQSSSAPATAQSDLYTFSSSTDRGSFRSVLRPAVDVSLSARAAGIVEVMHLQEGDPVKAGQAIMSLDSDQERAELAQARASVQGAKATADRATAELERIKGLRQENVYSEKQYLDAKAQAEVARSNYEQAEAALQLAQVRLANRDIVSPINGIFLKTNKLVGEAVELYETVARVVDITSLEMVVFCDAKYFSLFKTGQQVEVRVLKSTEDQPIVTGMVFHVDPIIDPSSGTFRVKIRIERSANAMSGLSAILIAPRR